MRLRLGLGLRLRLRVSDWKFTCSDPNSKVGYGADGSLEA